MSESDVEAVRRGLMMRDAGYGNPDHLWEQVGGLLKERDGLRSALDVYLRAQPQCTCGEHSGCKMGAARAAARRALRMSEAPAEEEARHG